MAAPHCSNDAFDESADQVESQLSAVQTRAKPTLATLESRGSAPHTLPQRRSDGSSDRSKQRGSASVRQTWKMQAWLRASR